MIKQGEIIEIKDRIATVRIYKDSKPTGVTFNATLEGDFSPADKVALEMNAPLLFLCSAFSYILPFVTSFAAYFIAGRFTDNIVFIEITILLTLALTYIFATLFEKTFLFEKLILCKVTKKSVG